LKEPLSGRRPCSSNDRLEELAYEAEREVALELGPSGTQNLYAAPASAFGGRFEETGLADPCRPFDDHHPAPAGARLLELGLELGELGLSLE
jgi:hypothetical protein